MPRKERAAAAKADLDALAARAAAAPVMGEHPFPVDEDDHCETPAEAYADIAPLLHRLAAVIGVAAADLRIWDPFYCNGAVKRHLADVGFSRVHNEPEDFYAVVREGKVPAFDVLLTNPAYSGDHIPRLLDICGKLGAVCLMLMPNYVAGKPYFAAAQKRWPASIGRTLFLVPPKRYSYWTPKGLRSKTQSHASAAGHRTSPFVSFWYACLGPHEAAVLRSLRFGVEASAAAAAASAPPAAGGAGGPPAASSAAAGATPSACRLRMFRSVAALPKGVRPSIKDEPSSKATISDGGLGVAARGDGSAAESRVGDSDAQRASVLMLASAARRATGAPAGKPAAAAAAAAAAVDVDVDVDVVAAGRGDAPITGAKRRHAAAADEHSSAPGGKRKRDSHDAAPAAASTVATSVTHSDQSSAAAIEGAKPSSKAQKEEKKMRKEKKEKRAAADVSAGRA